MFYRLAKARPPTPQVKQQFMLPSSIFEFGPLLVGKDRSSCLDGAHPDHTVKFRITNNGLFPLHADFWLKSEGTTPPDAASQEAKKKQGVLQLGFEPPSRLLGICSVSAHVANVQCVTQDVEADLSSRLHVDDAYCLLFLPCEQCSGSCQACWSWCQDSSTCSDIPGTSKQHGPAD